MNNELPLDPYTTPADEYVRLVAAMRARENQWEPKPTTEEEATRIAAERADADYWCERCNEAVEPTTKYDCGACGGAFGLEDVGSNQCPDCGRFAAKEGENYCPECLEEVVDA